MRFVQDKGLFWARLLNPFLNLLLIAALPGETWQFLGDAAFGSRSDQGAQRAVPLYNTFGCLMVAFS